MKRSKEFRLGVPEWEFPLGRRAKGLRLRVKGIGHRAWGIESSSKLKV
jgi:hypothetical protein